MSASDDITKQHDVTIPEKELDDSSGSGTLGSHDSDTESDDNVDESYQDYFGNKPRGKTIAEEVDQDEKDILES